MLAFQSPLTSCKLHIHATLVPDPLCVGLPSTRDDARLITHADAAAMAAQVPNMNYPAPGSGGLPLPRTVVEAMSMMAFARQQGVTAYWAASPSTESGDVHMHWPTEDASTLIYRKGESRCILIASGLGPRAHMYAHIKPCDSKVCDLLEQQKSCMF